MPTTDEQASSEIESVEPTDRAGWVWVTLRAVNGEQKKILVRKGSAFSGRPALTSA